MTRYTDASALRDALEARLKRDAEATGNDLGRLRRGVVFERLAVRLSVDDATHWIVKGGAALEFRLRNRARATRDLDLTVSGGMPDGQAARELLIDALAVDPDMDRFSFRVREPITLATDAGGRGAWRFSVEAWLAGKPFGAIRLDVARADELVHTEVLELPGSLHFAGIPTRSIEAVDRRQHFAEKLHALTRDYGDRPNTRVKDLVDLVLLVENGLPADSSLVEVAHRVFASRESHPLPEAIDDPPPRWQTEYPELADGLVEAAEDLPSALSLIRGFWAAAIRDAAAPDS